MNYNYFLIHGSYGNPFSNWFPWLRRKIEKENKEVYVPDFPKGIGYQNYDNWSKLLKSYLDAGLINENTIIFAHSIAPIFICKFLVQYKVKVKRLVFVSGFNNYFGINYEYDTVNESMFFDDVEEVKKYSDEIICYYSDNDPYVKYEALRDFAGKVATKEVCISNGGHLNGESNYIEFPLLLEHIN